MKFLTHEFLHPSDLLKVSQKLRVKIIKIDPDSKKVSTSIKALTENPFDTAIKRI